MNRLACFGLVLALGVVPSRVGAAEPPSSLEPSPELFPARRLTFVGGGVLALGGLGLGLYAQSEARRATTLATAPDTSVALDHARQAAASANLLYGLAGAAILYGLVLELLPPPAAEKASLTFHF